MAAISTAQLLRDALDGSEAAKVSIHDLVALMHNRAFGLGLFMASLLACLPMPPPIPAIGGTIIGFFAVQMMLGRRALKLPKWIGRREISRERLLNGIARVEKWITWIERLSRSRLLFLTGDRGKFVLGAVALTMGVILLLPIPIFGNLPPGLAVAVMALALIQRDGVLLLFGYAIAALAFVISGGATILALNAILSLPWI